MPRGRTTDDPEEGAAPRPSLWQRLKGAMLKPSPDDGTAADEKPARPVEEIEADLKSADDRERAIGLVAAPCAALIALLVTGSLISRDPAEGAKHVNPSTYLELGGSLVILAILMLAFAWYRKRLYLGIVCALYGLGIFNLHYWGFGVPFILVGAWLLVRAYRVQRELREARGDGPSGPAVRDAKDGGSAARPPPNKRYTPKATSPKPPPEPEPKPRRNRSRRDPSANGDAAVPES
jgi:hypothetical protein